jgi:hypothetical protein
MANSVKVITNLNKKNPIQRLFGRSKREYEHLANLFANRVLQKTMASIKNEGNHLSAEERASLTNLVEKSVLKWGKGILKLKSDSDNTDFQNKLETPLKSALHNYALEIQDVQSSEASEAVLNASPAKLAVQNIRSSKHNSQEASQGIGR